MIARAAAVVSVLALGTALQPGCAPPPSAFFFEEHFESLCEGVPCGWLVGGGPVGSVLWVETLPGEHGLALHGDRIAVLGPSDGQEVPDTASALDSTALEVFVGARCDEGADLELEVSVSDIITGGIDSYRGTVIPGTSWSDGLRRTALSRVGGTTGRTIFRDMVAIRILKSGPGVCEIDELGVGAIVPTR